MHYDDSLTHNSISHSNPLRSSDWIIYDNIVVLDQGYKISSKTHLKMAVLETKSPDEGVVHMKLNMDV